MLRKIIMALSLVALVVGSTVLFSASQAGASRDDDDDEPKVSICHRSDAVSNPYQKLSVDQSAVNGIGNGDHFKEHKGPLAYSMDFAQALKDDHEKWGDVIPPVIGTAAAAGYNWSSMGQAMWNNDCDYVMVVEELAEPTFTDIACDADGSYTIPETEGITYYIGDDEVSAGVYPVDSDTTISITAKANKGYFIDEEAASVWTHEFNKPTDCVLGAQSVTPDPVVFTAPTCDVLGFYTIPETNGVEYMLDGKVVASGKYTVQSGVTVTVTAVAMPDFELKEGATNQWTYTFTAPVDCGDVLGASTTTPTSLPLTSGDMTGASLTILSVFTSVTTALGVVLRKLLMA